jgi:TRAP-type mannitol/chloroaromatic compound transport system permease large subunit
MDDEKKVNKVKETASVRIATVGLYAKIFVTTTAMFAILYRVDGRGWRESVVTAISIGLISFAITFIIMAVFSLAGRTIQKKK